VVAVLPVVVVVVLLEVAVPRWLLGEAGPHLVCKTPT
jgi:hypothetical protein